MRILIVHNRYSKQGGEEQVVRFQQELFRRNGHDVVLYERANPAHPSLAEKTENFLRGFWNRRTEKEMERLVASFRPDFCLVHNLFHRITPSVLKPLEKASVPVAMVLHNYRLLCPVGILFRDGRICEECVVRPSREWRCVRHGCAGANSCFFAARNAFVRKKRLIAGRVDAFVALTDFQRRYMQGEVPTDVIPNALPAGSALPEGPRTYIGFSGRPMREKGIDLFFELARRMPETEFRIAGEAVSGLEVPGNVACCGFLQGEALERFYRGARMIVLASRWYEGFPMVILEAFRQGTPVAVPAVGGLPAIVDDGLNGIVYDPREIGALAERLRTADTARLGAEAREKFSREYNEKIYYERYMALYEKICYEKK